MTEPALEQAEEDPVLDRFGWERPPWGRLIASILLLSFWSGQSGAHTQLFPGPVYLQSPGGPEDVIAADLTGDGILDLVATGEDTGNLFLLKGKGSLRFQNARALTVAGRPSQVAAADLDQLLGPELIWIDELSGILYWAYATGDSISPYTSASFAAEGEETSGLAVADLNGDGWEDVIVSIGGGDELAFHFNDGAGNLLPAQFHRVGDGPGQILPTTRPGDALPRVIIAQRGALALNVGIYDGLDPVLTQEIDTGGPRWIEIAPWDSDELEDLFVVGKEGSVLQIQRLQGDGSYSLVREAPVDPGSVTVTTLESKGSLHRLVVGEARRDRLTIYEGIPGEGLSPRQSWFVGKKFRRVLSADLDGDGRVELVVPLPMDDRLAVVQQKGAGLLAYPTVPTGFLPKELHYTPSTAKEPPRLAVVHSIAPAVRIYEPFDQSLREADVVDVEGGLRDLNWVDWNHDEHTDFVVLRKGAGVEGYRAQSGGGFTLSLTIPLGDKINDLAVGDIDGDGEFDLAVADSSASEVRIFLGDGLGGFTETLPVAAAVPPIHICLVELNDDARSDLLLLDGTVFLSMLFRGDDSFSSSVRLAVGNDPRRILTAELNGDGLPDIVVVSTGGAGSYTSYVSRSPGVFALAAFSEALTSGFIDVRLAELSGDGLTDMVFADVIGEGLLVRQGFGDGTFGVGLPFNASTLAIAVETGDADGDGTIDIMVLDGQVGSVRILLQQPQPLVAVGGRLSARRNGSRVRLLVESLERLTVLRGRDRAIIPLMRVDQTLWEGWDEAPSSDAERYYLLDGQGRELDQAVVETSQIGSSLASLAPPMPNPARSRVSIRFRAPQSGPWSLRLIDARGRVIRRPQVSQLSGGWFQANWDGRDERGQTVARGRYFVDLVVAGKRFSRPLLWMGP